MLKSLLLRNSLFIIRYSKKIACLNFSGFEMFDCNKFSAGAIYPSIFKQETINIE